MRPTLKKFCCVPVVFLWLTLAFTGCGGESTRLSLAGEWQVALDSLDQGDSLGWNNSSFPAEIWLPGTTDQAGLGEPCTLEPELTKPQLLHLTRRHSYLGAAYYTREVKIPVSVANKQAILNLERVLWKSDVWVDGYKVDPEVDNSLTTPHRYDLTPYLTPGQTHRLTVRVDNRRQYDISVRNLAHAYTDDTQIIWNGMLGDLSIEFLPMSHIRHMDVFPDPETHRTVVRLEIQSDYTQHARVELRACDTKRKSMVGDTLCDVSLVPGLNTVELDCSLDETVSEWSEFSPELYRMEARLVTGDEEHVATADFGLRTIVAEGNRLMINGQPLFLRGTLECCIFPLTGTPPLDRAGWRKVIATAREWGLNHLRFHSWCPPEAAFEVADSAGFYLQVELPLWALNVGRDSATVNFLNAEADRILRNYGNHPSFCLMSMGNELQGDMQLLNNLMKRLKAADNRRLYTTTTFTFEKGYGTAPMAGDDFFITQWTRKGWVRGQGVFEEQPPQFDRDYRSALEGVDVPLITHEIGQYSVYPNLAEIEKYTGVLRPLNFEAVREDLKRKGLLDKAADYTRASGQLAALLYKEEIERALKTPGISGFQLLDLHDFPGQGTALVGLLDAFWESKEILKAEEFREFCAPVVPLVRYPKATYVWGERFTADLDVSNFSSEQLTDATLCWSLRESATGREVASGGFEADIGQGYNADVQHLEVDLPAGEEARKLTLAVSIEDTPYRNHWNLWVYPSATAEEPVDGNIRITESVDRALAELEQGRDVLLLPDWRRMHGVSGKFVPVFWSPVHFPKQAGTMGLLCDPKHPALASFPNDGHTDWQWWDLCVNSRTMVVDSLRGGAPIVEVIDNFTNNRRLAMICEGRVGKGRLIIASCDLTHDLDHRPAARQLRRSLLRYMQSDEFDPPRIENPELLRSFMGGKQDSRRGSASDIY